MLLLQKSISIDDFQLKPTQTQMDSQHRGVQNKRNRQRRSRFYCGGFSCEGLFNLSQSAYPSDTDINLTAKIKSALNLLDVKVVDHLIITDSDYCSFADEGII